MKRLKQLIPHLFRAPGSRQGKKGSSLAMVMMIGAALVIWVMCIMPLMSTTGSAVYKTQGDYESYLLSRSAIEFCKSELEKIVEEKLPYTFAVTGDLDEGFTAVAKWTNGLTVRPEYSSLVNSPDPLDDRKDVPTSDDVQAICAVETNATDPGIYDIVITTYKACEKQMTYKATFVPTGSLMIHPESYKQNQALPLSDFVVVDGKMGPNTVWNSNITMSNAESLDFNEVLLPLIDASHSDWHAGYANTGEYPAVFKTTANAAYKDGANITDPVTMGDLSSDQNWIMPKTGTTNENGNIWYSLNGNNLQIMMYANGNVNITEDCTVYLNGAVTRDYSVPAHGIYTVSIDYKGTDYSTDENLEKYDPEQVNVLPISGLKLVTNKATEINRVSTDKHTLSENIIIEKIDKVDYKNDQGKVVETTYTVTLTQPESADLVYCVTDSQGQNITWTESNVFEGLSNTPGTAYFFYACRPASYVDGVFKADSDVKYVGMLYAPKFVNSLTNNSKYSILGVTDDGYYALTSGADVTAVPADHGFIKSRYDAWTAISSNNGWSLRNSSNKYLRINATPDPQYTEEAVENHWSYSDSDYHDCTKYSCTECNWSFSAVIGQNMALAVASIDSTPDFTVSRTASHTEKYREYACYPSYWKDKEKTFTRTEYLSLNGGVSTSEETATVRFMELPPAAPSTPASPSKTYTIGDTVTYGTNVLNHVGSAVGSDEIVALYANGQQVNNILNAGSYHMVVKVKNGERETWANLGILTVAKYNLNNSEVTVTAERHAVDELRVDLSAAGWHENSGTKYFGYKKASDSTYHWFATSDSEYTFRLEYGTYQFAVKESGNVNYNGVESAAVEVAIAMKKIDLVAEDKPFFIYMMDDETGEITWYKLPKGILPGGETNRVLFVYGYTNNTSGRVEWSSEYKGQSYGGSWGTTFKLNRYAVYVEESNFDKDNDMFWGTTYLKYEKMFEINKPLDYGYVADRAPSMMRGSSLYFMGNNGSINTYGTDVYLTTDLLVLNSDIIGGGSVVVEPYNSMEYRPGDTLLFVSNPSGIVRGGQVIFQGRNFYRIPAYTDLSNLDASTAASWRVGDITNHTEKRDIDYLFRNKVFPEINLDIAYADRQQLSRIINSETIGWSRNGVISGSSTSSNPSYAITAYLTGMNGDVSYKANRVLIAANVGGAKTLNVTDDLSITTRYLSVEADQIIGTGGSAFMLYNLAQDQEFLMSLINSISGLSNYSSKSLQMDYERPTMIISNSGTITMQPQICRYDHGTNLLGNATSMSLMAEYSTSEIERLFRTGIFADSWLGDLLGSTVKTVDRYISLKADNEDGAITVSSKYTGNELDIYANYVYVDSSVKEINLRSDWGSNDIRVSSQESGYTTFEYLGIFKGHSAETYTGTILYFSGSVKINLGGTPKTVAPGFYWIQATDNGTSLTMLAENPAAYAIDPEELRDYSVYINPDGTLSNSYVDTGLLDNTNAGIGGFSGGNME